MSDARWALIEPVLTAWRMRRIGPGTAARVHDLREIVNAIPYVNRTGIPWEYLPHDLPPFKTVYDYYAKWEADGTTRAGDRREHDTAGGKLLLAYLAAAHPRVSKVWADGGYQSSIFNHGARHGIDVEVVQRTRATGFEPLPNQWVIERIFGWLMQHRRLARDYEALPQRSRTMIHWPWLTKWPAN